MIKYIVLLTLILNLNASEHKYVELQEQKENHDPLLTSLSMEEQQEIECLSQYIDMQKIKHNKDMFDLSPDIWCNSNCLHELFIIPEHIAEPLSCEINKFNISIASNINYIITSLLKKFDKANYNSLSYQICGYVKSVSGILVQIHTSNKKCNEYGTIISYEPGTTTYALLIHTSTYFKNLHKDKKELIRKLNRSSKKYLYHNKCIIGCIDYICIANDFKMSFSQFDKMMSDTFSSRERQDILDVFMIGINEDICYRNCCCSIQ